MFPKKPSLAEVFSHFAKTLADIVIPAPKTTLEKTSQAQEKSNLHYRKILEVTQEGFCEIDLTGRIVATNPRFNEMFGYEKGELIGLPVAEAIVSPEDQAGFREKLATRLKGKAVTYEQRFRKKTGETLWAIVSGSPLENEKGEMYGAFSLLSDITERKHAEVVVLAAHQKALQRLDNLLEGYQIIGSDWRFIYLNQAAIQQGRKKPEDFLGRTVLEVLPQIANTELHLLMKRCMEQRTAQTMTNEFTNSDGTRGFFELSIQPIPEGIAMFSIDVTERKRVEREAQESQVRLQSILNSMTDVVYSLSWPDNKLLFLSPSVEKVYGRTVQDFSENPFLWMEMIHPDDRGTSALAFEELRLKGFADTTRRILKPDGSTVWVQDRVRIIKDEKGAPLRVDGVLTDVTERKNGELALETSEAKFRAVVEHSGEGFVLMNAERSPFYVSPSYAKISGYSPEEWVGVSGPDFVHPDDRERTAKTWREVLQSPGKAIVCNYRLRHKMGHWFWVETVATNLLHVPEIRGIVLNSADVTERKRAERALYDNQERLKTIIETVGDPIFLKDNEHRILLANQAFFKAFGQDEKEVLGKTLVEAVPAEERAQFLAVDRSVLDTGIPDVREETLTANGGLTRTIVTRKARFVERTGEAFLVGTIHDLTDLRRIENEKRQLQTQLAHSERLASLGTLAAGVAHEINNPLAIIQGHLELVQGKCVDACGQGNPASVEKMQNATKRIATIVSGLLNFGRPSSEVLETVDVHKAICDTENLVSSSFKKENVTITYDFSGRAPLARANAGKIQQVIMNLLVNAKDAIKDTANAGIIKIVTQSSAAAVTISISDNGAGIDDSKIANIFEPFFTTKPAGKGTGLGLSISHSIVASFGGTIKVESQKGIGTTFIISLPVGDLATLGDLGALKDENAEIKTHSKIEGSILIVEDEEDIREILVFNLENLGLAVDEAGDGEEALKKLSVQKYDYVITDLQMPKMNGDELLLQAVKFPHLAATRFIVSTGGALTSFTSEQRENLKAHLYGVLNKPFNAEMISDLFLSPNSGGGALR